MLCRRYIGQNREHVAHIQFGQMDGGPWIELTSQTEQGVDRIHYSNFTLCDDTDAEQPAGRELRLSWSRPPFRDRAAQIVRGDGPATLEDSFSIKRRCCNPFSARSSRSNRNRCTNTRDKVIHFTVGTWKWFIFCANDKVCADITTAL